MRFKEKIKNIFFVISIFFILFYGLNIEAISLGDSVNFNVDENFDSFKRSQVSAVLIKTTPNLYFYVEKNWWNSQVLDKQNEILVDLENLSNEFSSKIYPILTSVYGSEWKPGVDGDNKIAIFFHAIKNNSDGYFRSTDEYIKLQLPNSNEREMIYLPITRINDPQLKVILAHEFVHLITFNQKDRINGVQEEVWLNEVRAEYASTILGYDNFYEGNNLQNRVKDFLVSPSDSLTEWQDTKYDYATANLFAHYLVDNYGINILSDSLKSKLIGIESINKILSKNGYKEDFSQIFTNWTIATIINDCSLDLKYCYSNKNLANLKINPVLIFLPLVGNSSLSISNVTKNWSGNWQKIIGGNGDLKLKFSSLSGLDFQVPYIIFDKNNNPSINFLNLDANRKGEIDVKDFGLKYNSLIIMPSLQTKTSGFNGLELTYPYTFTLSITRENIQESKDELLIQKLLAQIDSLKRQINAILLSKGKVNDPSLQKDYNLCNELNSDLYFGISKNNEVMCLQQFLKNEGQDIYPEALITGYFGNFTKSAVIRFQEKYKIFNTGFVGPITRTKINQLLK